MASSFIHLTLDMMSKQWRESEEVWTSWGRTLCCCSVIRKRILSPTIKEDRSLSGGHVEAYSLFHLESKVKKLYPLVSETATNGCLRSLNNMKKGLIRMSCGWNWWLMRCSSRFSAGSKSIAYIKRDVCKYLKNKCIEVKYLGSKWGNETKSPHSWQG